MRRQPILNICVALLIIAAFALTHSASASTIPQMSGTLNTRYFVVQFDPTDPYLARLISGMAQDELLRVSKDLGYQPTPKQPFDLRVYSSHRLFVTNEDLSNKLTTGITESRYSSIAIDASGMLVTPREVLAHEITHAIVFRILGRLSSRLPLWFNEGLAKYESGNAAYDDDELISDASANDSLMPLSIISIRFPEKRIDLAYAESSSAMRMLIREHGQSAPRKVIQDMAHTGSFDTAMRQVTNQSASQFADHWYNATTKHYFITKFARALAAVMAVLMAVLSIVAFIVRRKRMEEAARRWEQEEFEEALRRQQGNDWSL